ncbi:MAG: hypothetical protein DCC59_04455 [Chloroflexi bacterium]|nr:hypothetical protein [Anaerolineales bacterium]MCE7918058.1 hypothetical protein [Chloroflexi bacterium CFX1]MCQ3952549.1 hypothetical protein [Chloroflexota bacterium]MDL1919467.1 hypothetical protein [Chloroflexi bacterium CFX5]MCK6568059.1 hypothetical protein [Anaerolineales bacterium]
MENKNAKRTALLIAGGMDALLGAIGLLFYFGLLPFDLDAMGIPRWVAGVVGAALFFSGLAVFAYNLSAPDSTE